MLLNSTRQNGSGADYKIADLANVACEFLSELDGLIQNAKKRMQRKTDLIQTFILDAGYEVWRLVQRSVIPSNCWICIDFVPKNLPVQARNPVKEAIWIDISWHKASGNWGAGSKSSIQSTSQ